MNNYYLFDCTLTNRTRTHLRKCVENFVIIGVLKQQSFGTFKKSKIFLCFKLLDADKEIFFIPKTQIIRRSFNKTINIAFVFFFNLIKLAMVLVLAVFVSLFI